MATTAGLTPIHDNWPLAGLCHWGSDSPANTMSAGPELSVRSLVHLRFTFCGLRGERRTLVARVQLFLCTLANIPIISQEGVSYTVLGPPMPDAKDNPGTSPAKHGGPLLCFLPVGAS